MWVFYTVTPNSKGKKVLVLLVPCALVLVSPLVMRLLCLRVQILLLLSLCRRMQRVV